MKAKVLISFSDYELKTIHKEGAIIEISEDRLEKIKSINENFVETVDEEESKNEEQSENEEESEKKSSKKKK